MGLFDSLFGSGGGGDRNAALDAVKNIPLPVLKEMNPELYKQVVQLNPELENAITLGSSDMGGISLDPSYKAAQMGALNKLQDITSNGGRDAQFQADAARLQNDVNTNLQGNVGAIQQNLATRGMGGGMQEMVSKQMAAQNAANQQSQMGLDLNAQAQQRALSALMNQNQVASGMSQQDFGQAAQKAQASDAINRFNAQNQQQVVGANVDRRNNAQQFNATGAQQAANQNVGVKNDAQQYNLNLPQQNYNNATGQANNVATQIDNRANARDKDRDREAGLWGNIISGGATAYGANANKK